ncbi:prepilin-type N-terminal cleavage/methylation domain-containing protein [Silvimonas amylolytica]|uniref:prepilin-type N-terminal cleavage/methylation domain-containing protein n=1 Tax=Silvimonas amylolytica TaxID=449663 RepID=UPI001662EBF1|nr:prepilin-type N-terminal cleavage/methylation domain-containing protein [Silvimonas amylolytica]
MKRSNGFSLIELTVVLTVLGLLLGGALNAIRLSQEADRIRAAQMGLQVARQALVGHMLRNGRLPCAASTGPNSKGLEERDTDGRCAHLQGYLPWATLGLPRNDSWGRPYTYRVSEAFAQPNTRKQDQPLLAAGMVFHLLTQGDLEIRSSGGSDDDLTHIAAAVIVSHGAHGPGPLESGGHGDEAINTSDSPVFISKTQILQPPEEAYDDLTVWLGSPQLIAAALEAGRLP